MATRWFAVFIIAVDLSISLASVNEIFPFQDVTLSWEDRVKDLVDRLTLEELVNTVALGGGPAGPNIAIPRLNIPPFNFDTECLRGICAPTDATSFPQSVGLAASFSPDLLKMMATVISTEARAIFQYAAAQGDYSAMKGITCFAPFINIMRHPLWGRNQEVYGEDPFLSGILTEGYVIGLQGDHPRYARAAACCKVIAVHSGPDNIPSPRYLFNAVVSERDLWLTYLPQFKRCSDAGSLSMMCSYNSINGVPACGSKRFLTDIVRTQWGFNGFMISDMGAVPNIFSGHHYANSYLEAAAVAANTGTTIELPDRTPATYLLLKDAVQQGLVSMDTLRFNAGRAFYVRMKLGMFDPPELNPYSNVSISVVQSEPHRKLALIAALKTFVLLKNDKNLLPLVKGSVKTLAIVGPMADNMEQLMGDYSPSIDPRYSTTPYQGLNTSANKVVLESGCKDGNPCKTYNKTLIQQAVQGADQVIVCLGLGQQFESESNDRSDMMLPGNQDQLLLDAIQYAKAPVILLVFTGGPVTLTNAKTNPLVGAIIQCWYPAQSTGEALSRVLFTHPSSGLEGRGARGDATSPGARLPYTWPVNLDQVPPMINYSMEGRTYRYFNGPGDPLYPFGYGLSYSQFHYTDLFIQPTTVKQGDTVTVFVNVYNLGPYDADEVTQVYVSWRNSPVKMPKLQLVAIANTMIEYMDEPYALTLKFEAEQLKVWDDVYGFVFYKGDIDVYVGGQQPNQATTISSNVLQGVVHTTVSI